jgi:DNA-binding NarL/FixJ family response regulator
VNTRVAIVVAAPLVRGGLVAMVRATPGLQLAGAAESIAAWLARGGHSADVLLAQPDADDPTLDATLATALPLVVLTDRDSQIDAALSSGATVLPTTASARTIVAAIDAAVAGLVALAPAQASALVARTRSASDHAAQRVELLTPRELEVLDLLAHGLANRAVAAHLHISAHTAKFHVGQILAKLGAVTRAQAVAIGLRDGLVDASQPRLTGAPDRSA